MKQPINQVNNGIALLQEIINKKEVIYIEAGILTIESVENTIITGRYSAQQRQLLVETIVKLHQINAYRYVGFSTGSYNKGKCHGITLRFKHLLTGEQAFVIFNASLKRAKTTKYGKKGEPLSGKKFIVSRNSKFYHFWQSTGLRIPSRLSEFHCYMGNLKSLLFCGIVDYRNRFIDKDISLTSVSAESVLIEINHQNNSQQSIKSTDIVPTSHRQRLPTLNSIKAKLLVMYSPIQVRVQITA